MTAITAENSSKPIIVAVAVTLLVAIPGAMLTELGSWYASLIKPAWQPPAWLFAPAWTVIYALAATAAVIAWRASPTPAKQSNLFILFMLNAVLNVLWSLLFFRLERPDLALMEVAFLWSSIVLLIYACYRRARPAAVLLVPYLLWVSIASVLNAEIVRLNGPF